MVWTAQQFIQTLVAIFWLHFTVNLRYSPANIRMNMNLDLALICIASTFDRLIPPNARFPDEPAIVSLWRRLCSVEYWIETFRSPHEWKYPIDNASHHSGNHCPKTHRELYALMRRFDAFMTDHEHRYFLDSGSLLGAYRDKQIIHHDDDLDVAMLAADFDAMCDWEDDEFCLEKNPQCGTYSYQNMVSAVFVNKRNGRYVDIFCLRQLNLAHGDTRHYTPFLHDGKDSRPDSEKRRMYCRDDEMFPLIQLPLGDAMYPCPRETDRILRRLYGSDLSPPTAIASATPHYNFSQFGGKTHTESTLWAAIRYSVGAHTLPDMIYPYWDMLVNLATTPVHHPVYRLCTGCLPVARGGVGPEGMGLDNSTTITPVRLALIEEFIHIYQFVNYLPYDWDSYHCVSFAYVMCADLLYFLERRGITRPAVGTVSGYKPDVKLWHIACLFQDPDGNQYVLEPRNFNHYKLDLEKRATVQPFMTRIREMRWC
jgi:hypothetical protein